MSEPKAGSFTTNQNSILNSQATTSANTKSG